MSLIDQALKKTQSALHQKTRNVPPAKPIVHKPEPIPHTVHAIPPKYPKMKSRTASDFNFNNIDIVNFITNRWVLGTASLLFVAMLTVSMHPYFSYIGQRYVQFYGHLFEDIVPTKSKPTLVVAPKPVIPMIPLELNGTIQVEHQRVALINHKLYHLGEMIDGYKIKQIRYNYVDLQNIETHQKRVLTPELSQ